MASLIARRAFSTTARRLAGTGEEALKTESKKNPEIMVRQNSHDTRTSPGNLPTFLGFRTRQHIYGMGVELKETHTRLTLKPAPSRSSVVSWSAP
jgi:hypothetical protein